MGVIKGIVFALRTLIGMAIVPILTISVAEHYNVDVELFDYLIIVYIALISAALVFTEKTFLTTRVGLSGVCGVIRYIVQFWYISVFLDMIKELSLPESGLTIHMDYSFYKTLIFVGIGLNLFRYMYQVGYRNTLKKPEKKKVAYYAGYSQQLGLQSQCPSCQNANLPQEKFCKFCGQKLK